MVTVLLVFRSLVRREVRDQLRRPLFVVLTVVAIAIVPFAINEGTRDLSDRQRAQRQLLEQRTSDALRASYVMGQAAEPSMRILQPPASEGVFVAGLESALPQYWEVSPAGLIPEKGGVPGSGRPASPLDLAFAFRDVLGLLAIMLAIEALAGDRDSGRLSTLLTQPVNSSSVLWAKFVGGVLALGLAVCIVTVSAALVAARRTVIVSVGGTTTILSLLAAASIFYLAVTYAAGLLLAVVVRRRETAAVAGLAIWIATVLVFEPIMSTRVSAALSAVEFGADWGARQFNSLLAASEGEIGDLCVHLGCSLSALSRDQVDHVIWAAMRQRWLDDAVSRRTETRSVETRAIDESEHHLEIGRAIALGTPASEFAALSSALADTGWDSVERWTKATQDYQRALESALFDNPSRINAVVTQSGREFVFSLDNRRPPQRNELPVFKAPVADLRQRIVDAAPAAGTLALWGLGCMWIAARRFHQATKG